MKLWKKKLRSTAEKLPPWILTSVTVGAILWLTLASHPLGDGDLPLFPGADKLAHAIMFGGLTLMICLDETRLKAWKRLSGVFILAAMVISSGLGIGVEFLQRAMHAGRTFDIYDMAADCAGAALAALLWLLTTRFHDARKRNFPKE